MDSGKEDLAAIDFARLSEPIPTFCVHVHISVADDPAFARQAVRSALKQSEKPYRVFITSDGDIARCVKLRDEVSLLSQSCDNRMAGLRAALVSAYQMGADYLVPVSVDASLPQHALAGYAAFLIGHGKEGLPLLFGDEAEKLKIDGTNQYWLKPGWDRRMILSQDYISAACALPVRAAIASMKQDEPALAECIYELVLRMCLPTKAGTPVRHLPRVTMRTPPGHWQGGAKENLRVVQQFVGGGAKVSPGPYGTVILRWQMPRPSPKVSVIVGTRDQADLLRTCVNGVLHKTRYPAIELIIVDNDSHEAEALDYMEKAKEDPRVRIVRWPHPFNYSAINNCAAKSATGEYLCLLNNDIEVIDPEWLCELVREAAQPQVGAVGARLLYPDRSIQHAGVAVGIGNAAGHAHRGLPEGKPGYFAQALITRGATAVTGACLLVSKCDFDAVGGLDEDDLAVAYNDVDLCLKLHARGFANIYAPTATLIHHESKSRGLDFSPEQVERYMRELNVIQKRWGTKKWVDWWHHPRLDRSNEVFN